MSETKKPQAVETFHLQSNLSNTLYEITMKHSNSIQKDNPNLLPPFVKEALHVIFQDVAKIVNSNYAQDLYWKDINLHSQLVTNIIQTAKDKQNGKEST